MNANVYDILVIAGYFLGVLGVGLWKGRGRRSNSSEYFVAKKSLPWWVIAAAFVATGMNSEQLVGQNGMGYKIGLTMINWYMIVAVVYSLLIFVFLPIYFRNAILTMPEYLGKRFDVKSQNVFTVILLLSYVFVNLAVVFYGGGKLLEVVFGINIWYGVIMLGVVVGLYTMYGGMTSTAYAAVFQFALIFISGFALFGLAYAKLPNGWSDVVAHAPGGFHLIQPMDYPVIPWHAIPLTLLGLHLYYSCINQALVQQCFGARREWDARMGMIVAGLSVLMRPFVEILPGMICRALAAFDSRFSMEHQPIDNVYPTMIRELVPAGMRGLILVGILASVMSTIAAFLNSISTMFTMDVYKKWINQQANETRLVKVGTTATGILMIFSIGYSPLVGIIGGGIFNYFQMLASYVAVPIATVFLVGILWKKATSAAAFTVMLIGIPLGIIVNLAIPRIISATIVAQYSLDNYFITSAITQVLCVLIMIMVSLGTRPKPVAEISGLVFSKEKLFLPSNEPHRPWYQSIWFWWIIFIMIYVIIYVKYR
jgi:solute:Na+ symporter, SSS family